MIFENSCQQKFRWNWLLLSFIIQVEGSSQTELKHPKNVYTQYEPRIFSEEEVEVIWNSEPMKKFLARMDDVWVDPRVVPKKLLEGMLNKTNHDF